MSSLVKEIQLKWVQEVWACPIWQYSAREHVKVEHVQRKDFIDGYGQPKGEDTDK